MKNTSSFLEKETVSIDGKEFVISCLPAILAQKVYTEYIKSSEGWGNLGMSMLPENISLPLLEHTAVVLNDGTELVLENKTLIETHCPKLKTLISLEVSMIRKNFDFLFNGNLLEVLGVEEQENKAE